MVSESVVRINKVQLRCQRICHFRDAAALRDYWECKALRSLHSFNIIQTLSLLSHMNFMS